MKQFFLDSSITPTKVLAGDSVEFNIKLFVGKDFSADNTRIVLDLPGYLGYSRPALLHNEFDGYVTILCSNPTVQYEKKIWNISKEEFVTAENVVARKLADRLVIVDFLEGQISSGDEIVIKWGFLNNGFGTGTKVSTIVLEKKFYNTIHVRYFLDQEKALPDFGRSFADYERPIPEEEIALKYRILPRNPERIRLVRKKPKSLLQIFDRFSNICNVESPSEYLNEEEQATINEYGVFEVDSSEVKINSGELPVSITPEMENAWKDYNIYFGDLHTHSTFSVDCIEREKMKIRPDGLYKFARQVAGLDFLAITDHHEPHHGGRGKIMEWQWEEILEAARKNTVPGQFVAFPGFEYRCERGDTAIVFNDEISFQEIDKPEMKNITQLWEQYQGKNYITIPHFHNPGSLEEDQWYQCPYPDVEPNIEIFSCHESYEKLETLERKPPQIKAIRPDRNGEYFLNSGYKYGFTCNSDGHKGNPGFSGLTAVYAKELTPDSIMEAIREKRVYGTTNARIRLLFTINDAIMGSTITAAGEKEIFISVCGEDKLKSIELIKNSVLYQRFTPNSKEFEKKFVINDEEQANWYVKAIQQDNQLAYSSPIWVE